MYRFTSSLVLLVAVAIIASGCGGDDSVSNTPTTPASATVVDTFTGTLTLNGGTTFPFTVTGVGAISALLTTLAPDAAKPVGLSLGTWNGSACQIVLAKDASIQGTSVIGQSSTIGAFCVRVYDAAGTVSDPQTFAIEVTHQ